MAGTESRVLETLSTVFPLSRAESAWQGALTALDPGMAAALVRAVYREFKNNPRAHEALELLFSRVEFSDRALSDWIEQIVRLYGWLEARGDTALFSDVVEYVSCSMHGSASQPGHDLVWYLEQYGFEKRRRKAA